MNLSFFHFKCHYLSLLHNLKIESAQDSLVTPPLSKERLPRTLYRPVGMGMGYSSSDSLDHHPMQPRFNYDSTGPTVTPKLSSISGAKTETSSMDASIRTSSLRETDRSGEISISNASDLEVEWVEQDEPGVYITIRAIASTQTRQIQPREVRGDACESVVGREPCEDTQTILVIDQRKWLQIVFPLWFVSCFTVSSER